MFQIEGRYMHICMSNFLTKNATKSSYLVNAQRIARNIIISVPNSQLNFVNRESDQTVWWRNFSLAKISNYEAEGTCRETRGRWWREKSSVGDGYVAELPRRTLINFRIQPLIPHEPGMGRSTLEACRAF